MYLRAANINDRYLTWKWANDPVTRSQSFTTGVIDWDDHKIWFESVLSDPDSYFFIAIENGTPVGVIRFNKKAGNAEISVNIAPEQRGKGYGSNVIKMGSTALFNATNVEVINAYIKPDNTASKNAFIKAGYVLSDTVSVMNQPALHLCCGGKIKCFD